MKVEVIKVEAFEPPKFATFTWTCPICGDRNSGQVSWPANGKLEVCSGCGAKSAIDLKWISTLRQPFFVNKDTKKQSKHLMIFVVLRHCRVPLEVRQIPEWLKWMNYLFLVFGIPIIYISLMAWRNSSETKEPSLKDES